ncbi:augmin subunit 6 [Tanacetum coccineum]
MTMEREKELESAMYTNCLLLGLDPSIIGSNRVGLFRHSNRKLGEQLLYFILSSLRGPKDFDKERTYAADVVSNPLPASLTDVAFSHAATLLPVTKAGLEISSGERRFLKKNAGQAVQETGYGSKFGLTRMTEEYRGLCAKRKESTEKKAASLRSKQLFVPESQTCLVENRVSGGFKYSESLDTCSNFDMLNDYDGVNGFLSAAASNYAESEGRLSFYDVEESHEEIFSPPFLMDASLSADSFEDLLGITAPLSETETAALMEH